MKIEQSDYDYLKAAMLEVKDKIPAHIDFLKQPENLAKIKDFDTRLRWDWFWAAIKRKVIDGKSFYTKLDYLNDEHINTALKKIVKEINLPKELEIGSL